jgi:hypothetical protein
VEIEKLRKAMQVLVWKSDDGKLFECETAYKKHVRKLNKIKREEKEYVDSLRIETAWWEDNIWNAVKSPEQLVHAIKKHSSTFVANGMTYIGNPNNIRKNINKMKFHSLNFDFGFSPLVSNTHSAPVGKEQNWYRKDDLPKGYPGLTGYLRYSVYMDKKHHSYYPCGSDMWTNTRIHTGSGGGGSMHELDGGVLVQSFSYEYKIFLDDFPAMKESFDNARVLLALRDDYKSVISMVDEMYPASGYQSICGESL